MKLFFSILVYLLMAPFEPLQLFIYDCGDAIGINSFKLWFIFLSLLNLIILYNLLQSKISKQKIILTIDIIRNIICILPILFPKFYYVFYNGLNGIDIPYLFGINIYNTLTILEFSLVGFYGIVNWIIHNSNLDRAGYPASYFHLSETKREKKC